MERINFDRVRGQVLEFYRQGYYREALEVALVAKGRFPEKEGEVSWWIACLTRRLGNVDGALEILREALRAGPWWGEYFLNDPDLEPLRERQRAAQVQARARLSRSQ